MDSIFRTRGSGVSSDVENTIVPQLLSEINGVEGLENVIVIGASNREDMIDPAILRPGRLDVKIKIERPDAEAAKDIFSKYVLTVLPLHPDDVAENGGSSQATVDAMILRTVERMYTESEENRFLEVTYANGDQVTYANGNKEVLYFNDFNSRWLHGLNRVLISTFASICSGWSPPRRRMQWLVTAPPPIWLVPAVAGHRPAAAYSRRSPGLVKARALPHPAVLAMAGWGRLSCGCAVRVRSARTPGPGRHGHETSWMTF